jgi:dihydrofolate synthase / folylpolyglutamate synthase
MFEETAYQKALEYLYSFVDYSMTRSFRYAPDKFDLNRMRDLLHSLGDPQEDYGIIHVAGTKGKGSTSAMIASALQAGDYRTGFYTSPHLQDYTERIQVNGQPISQTEFVELIEEMKPHVDLIQRLTTFEITTALALLYYARKNVDIAVVEVGLGGRLDATNVVDPIVTVITSLSYDHMNVLGNTLTEIASEKAGIIKEGRPIVTSPQKDEAVKVIQRTAVDKKAPLTEVGRDYLFASWKHSMEGQTFLIWTPDQQEQVNNFIETSSPTWQPLMVRIPLLGQHQVENAVTAYAALQVANRHGLRISEDDIQRGFENVFWPGRFEVLRSTPPLIVDSAHNRDSALRLRLAMEDYLPGVPIVLLYGASEDKDIHGMFEELMPRVRQVICTESFHPRAMKADKLVELAHLFARPAEMVLPVEAALVRALEAAGDDAAVVATGSLFISAAVRECWRKMGNSVRNFNFKA